MAADETEGLEDREVALVAAHRAEQRQAQGADGQDNEEPGEHVGQEVDPGQISHLAPGVRREHLAAEVVQERPRRYRVVHTGPVAHGKLEDRHLRHQPAEAGDGDAASLGQPGRQIAGRGRQGHADDAHGDALTLGAQRDGLADPLVKLPEGVAAEHDLAGRERGPALDDRLPHRALHGFDAGQVDLMAVDGNGVGGGEAGEGTDVPVAGQPPDHRLVERVDDRVSYVGLGVGIAHDDVPVPSLLAGSIDEVVQADAERHRRDQACHRQQGAEERRPEAGPSSPLERHPYPGDCSGAQPRAGHRRAQRPGSGRSPLEALLWERSGGAPRRDHGPQQGEGGYADEADSKHGGVDGYSGVDLGPAGESDRRERRQGDGDRHGQGSPGQGDDAAPGERYERELAGPQPERREGPVLACVGGDLSSERLADHEQGGEGSEPGEEQQGDRLQVDGSLRLVPRVLDLGASDVDVFRLDIEGWQRPHEGRRVCEAVAEPDTEALDPRQGLVRHALVLGEAGEERGCEHQAAGALVDGVADDGRRRDVDVGRRPHDPDNAEGVRRSLGRRDLAEAADRHSGVLLGREGPHRHPAADLEMAEAGGRVVDDRLVGSVETGEAPLKHARPVHRAERVRVGGGEGVDATELPAGLVG